jgi:hypothetical protein
MIERLPLAVLSLEIASMSVIQPILERLQHDCAASKPPERPGDPTQRQAASAPLRDSWLGSHATWYRENLGHCNEAMLQYEWAWMSGRIATLRHFHGSGSGPAACADARGADGSELSQLDPRLSALLSESQLFRTLLLQEFSSRGMTPMPPRGTVVASEEAWEITSTMVRQEWGIL